MNNKGQMEELASFAQIISLTAFSNSHFATFNAHKWMFDFDDDDRR